MSTKRISLFEIFIWIFVLLFLILVLSPFGLGFKIKNDYSILSQKMSDMMQADLSIVHYGRGYFSSDVTMELSLPGYPTVLTFKENIVHGPVYLGLLNQGKSPFVAAVVKGELDSVQNLDSLINQIFSGKTALVYQSVIDFAGNTDTEGYMPAVDAVIDQGESSVSIQSSSMYMRSYYSASDEQISGESALPKFSLSSDDNTINLINFNINFSGKKGINNLLVGDTVLSLEKLDIQSDTDQFALSKFFINSVTTEEPSLINSTIRLNAHEMLLSNQQLGPITFALTLNGLAASSINQLSEMQNNMEEQIQKGMPQEQATSIFAGKMISIIPELLKQAVMTIDPFSVQSELGKLEVSVDFSVDGLDQNKPVDPMFLLNAINLEIDMSADEALMKQLVEWQLKANAKQEAFTGSEQARHAEASISMPQKVNENLKGLVDENWLIYGQNKYASLIKLQQGLMTINDKQVDPLAQIMSQMGGAAAKAPAVP